MYNASTQCLRDKNIKNKENNVFLTKTTTENVKWKIQLFLNSKIKKKNNVLRNKNEILLYHSVKSQKPHWKQLLSETQTNLRRV